MVYRFEFWWRRIRNWFDRSEWMIRLLKLPVHTGAATKPGLVMVQIDGLSRSQFERALRKGEMPFLRKLMRSEHYHLHTHYPGLPTSTPAVQGELFYGVKTAVPAFSFLDRQTGNLRRMYDPEAASAVEQKLAKQGEALLAGGSSYSNIFTGGAQESHFCPASLGWGLVLRAANPFVLSVLAIANIYSLARTASLLFLEMGLAIVDFVRGLIEGRDLIKEFKFIPTRVAICILLRELITIGAKIDITRGLPIIHLNLLGYDEQAHRRGPNSNFAHWTLKGIDDAIARIWRRAHHASRRHYDVWIYSDHGQEETIPYTKAQGRTIQQAVSNVFENINSSVDNPSSIHAQSIQTKRANLLGGKRFQKWLPTLNEDRSPSSTEPIVAAMGPIGHIYTQRVLEDCERDFVGRALIEDAKIPLVVIADDSKQIKALTKSGSYSLPKDKATIFGSDHPFLEAVTKDVIELCRHPDAGDLVIFGWCNNHPCYSFPIENGSHAGPGPEETRAFALLPGDTVLPQLDHEYLRPLDLRNAAQRFLGRTTTTTATTRRATEIPRKTLSIMTYNVHSCIGMDGKIAPERIARVIARHQPDVVALQELDVQRTRTGSVDQAHRIAELLEMEFHFHPALHIEEERYGDAILTHLPMQLVKSAQLPSLPQHPSLEPRGAIWVSIDVDGVPIHVINTHLGLRPAERRLQVDALTRNEWLNHPECDGKIILCGDLNALPKSYVCKRLGESLIDAQARSESRSPKATFFGRLPSIRIDHVFIDKSMSVLDVKVPNAKLERLASDHLPLLVQVRL